MIDERTLAEINGLVAHFRRAKGAGAPHATLFAIQCRLMVLGVKLDNPVEAPDPTAPAGGSALALKAA